MSKSTPGYADGRLAEVKGHSYDSPFICWLCDKVQFAAEFTALSS
jgi:hypothetical protein